MQQEIEPAGAYDWRWPDKHYQFLSNRMPDNELQKTRSKKSLEAAG